MVKEIKPDSLVKVVVESGKVSFSFQNENVILTKDMSATLNLRTKKITIDSNVNKNIGAWKSKKLHFRSTSMKEVIHQIEKLYEVNFEIKNPSILNCELSATFDNEDLEDILMIIESTFGFQIEHIYNKIVIKGNGC